MKAFLAACVVCALITAGAWFALTNATEFTAAGRNVSDGAVRLGDAGTEDTDVDLRE
ncbi:hypothetical protein OCH239_08680 [Roseivivax halodurans JCM 10272]|uniref:Uncharacterized protein n=1 Tax=Roseivivax halodurans JCM 10272 TaxID=1449350 RepID=X7EM79_9RHOB|nr:hypothetical protein [Roseivivax halodurans]ETX16263.1 hypothetical protein OCH239_08680 [Roseivivax halodurans JCM 10272]